MAKKSTNQPVKESKNDLTKKQYEQIGRMMESIVMHGYASKYRLLGLNFLRGVFFGFGSIVGTTIILLTLIFLLSLFSELPFIGDFFETIQNSIQESTRVNGTL